MRAGKLFTSSTCLDDADTLRAPAAMPTRALCAGARLIEHKKMAARARVRLSRSHSPALIGSRGQKDSSGR